LVVPLVLLSALLNAQAAHEIDSIRTLSEDLIKADSLIGPPEEEITDDTSDNDPPAVTTTTYFLRKESQANGGGPDTLNERKLPDSVLKRLQASDDFWYVNYLFEKQKKQQELKEDTPFTELPIFQTILWLIIIGGFATFVILYLSNSNVGLFRKKDKPFGDNQEAEPETDNIFEINYQQEIDKAVSNGNYRFAVRLMFLRLLKNLSDKKLIDYKPDRTDFDYLLQVSSTKYYQEFFKLTRNYEFTWYGLFDIDPEKFKLIRKDFENFDSKLR
jgi:hypothetical protein